MKSAVQSITCTFISFQEYKDDVENPEGHVRGVIPDSKLYSLKTDQAV